MVQLEVGVLDDGGGAEHLQDQPGQGQPQGAPEEGEDDVLRQEKFGAGGLQFDLRFPGRVIVRPLTKDGGTTG